MDFRKVSQFRLQAEKCFRQSELTDDRASKFSWLALAEAWLLMSENMGKPDICQTFGVWNEPQSVHRQIARH